MSNQEQGRELRARLESDDGTFPESWRPEPGEILVGEFVGYKQRQAKGRPAKIAIIKTEPDGKLVCVWLLRTVLEQEFESLRPKPGEVVGIKYHGQLDGNMYHSYTVEVCRDVDADAPIEDVEIY